jgi:hypothetical protein
VSVRVHALTLLLAALSPQAPGQQAPVKLLDGFDDISAWKAVASDNVKASLRQADGVRGKALCLDYDSTACQVMRWHAARCR